MGLTGKLLKLEVRGASHADAIKFTLSGFPADFPIDEAELARFMARRAPGGNRLSTSRQEPDVVKLSRCENGIEGIIRNTDIRPGDYGAERTIPRPGHADFGQWVELGRIPTGGGKNSGRMTAALNAAGGLCKQLLAARGIAVRAEVASIGHGRDAAKFESEILAAKAAGDSVGGTIRACVSGFPAGIGGALFEGLESSLAAAIFAIPGVKGIGFGNGFQASELRGSENNDEFIVEAGEVRTSTNRHGGLLGGRTSGMPIEFTVAMKPTPTIFRPETSIDLATMTSATLKMKGRHDPCIVLRAAPVVEAVSALVLLDALLAAEAAHPRICLTLTGRTLREDRRQYEAQRYFTDLVELRVDLLSTSEREVVIEFIEHFPVPVIVTFRRQVDGGAFVGPEAERKLFFKKLLLSNCRAAYVDFEADFREAELSELAAKAGVRIIRSLHDFSGKPGNVVELCRRLRGETNEIPKIAFLPKSLDEVSELFAESKGFRDFPHIVCAMGPKGLVTRVLAARLGSMLTYTSVGGLEELGHITAHELVRIYRFRQQREDFALYGVTGFPLKSTRSPELNNLAWSDGDEDKLMIPFPSENAEAACRFLRAMKLRGLAVTIPHKESIMPLVENLDAGAAAIGAVNTVVMEAGGSTVGYNTDAEGFSAAIRNFVGKDDFAGIKVAVLGAGGAAKAVVYALKSLRAQVEVFHRKTPPSGFDLIVNATPVDPIPDYSFTGGELVYDLVYVPGMTPLMARAQAAGCRVENGFSMLCAQAAAQRRLWA